MNTIVQKLPVDAVHRLPAVGEAGHVPLEWLVEDPRNPRTHFDPDELRELADSLAMLGQLELMTVRPLTEREKLMFRGGEYMITSGARRSRALKLAGIAKARVIVTEYEDDTAQIMSAFVFNVARVGYSDLELMNALVILEQELGKVTYEHLSKLTKVPKAKVADLLTVHSNADPSVLEWMAPERPDKKRLRLEVAVKIVVFDLDRQKKLLKGLPPCDSAKEQIEWIRSQAEATGVSLRFRETSPREQRRFLQVFARKVRRDAAALLKKDLTRIAETDRPEELLEIQESYEAAIAQLGQLRQLVVDARGVRKTETAVLLPTVPASPVQRAHPVTVAPARQPPTSAKQKEVPRPGPKAWFPEAGFTTEVWDPGRGYVSHKLNREQYRQAAAEGRLRYQREGRPLPKNFPDPERI